MQVAEFINVDFVVDEIESFQKVRKEHAVSLRSSPYPTLGKLPASDILVRPC